MQEQDQQISGDPIAFINVEKRRLEWAVEPWSVKWTTPTTVKLARIPLFAEQRPATVTDAMAEAAARALSDIHAKVWGFDKADVWAIFGDAYTEDARKMLEAALSVAEAC